MKTKLTEQQKEKLVGYLVIILGVAVFMGQIAETRSGFLREWSYVLRMYIDPLQYMIGMLMINFIMVITCIKKHSQFPNPILGYLKWYFSILLVNDFLILVLRVIQKSNVLGFRDGLVVGVGRSYMMLASGRAIIDLTLTLAALALFVYGLIKYAPDKGDASPIAVKPGKVALVLLAFQWLASVPVNLSGLITGRILFAVALGLSQAAQIAVMALLYWIVREYYQKYRTLFFSYLTKYYALSFIIAGLVFTYAIGSYGIMQRFPSGELELMGSFGQLVFYTSRLGSIVLSYLMFLAVTGYSEITTKKY